MCGSCLLASLCLDAFIRSIQLVSARAEMESRSCFDELQHRQTRGHGVSLEPESPNEGACLSYLLNRNRLSVRGQRARLRYMINHNRQMRRRV